MRTERLPSHRDPKAITATAHKLARILYNLMRHGIAYMRKEEDAYAQQVRDRLEKQLRRRARELGFEVNKLQSSTLTFPDGEVVTVDPRSEILDGK
ncbi:hypothetical protein BH10PLA2_BH10PLA2_14110 [soil metagenome]